MNKIQMPQLEMGYSQQQRAVKINLSRALMVAVPGENPVHYRPVVMTFNEHSRNDIQNIVDNGLNINTAALRNVARDILRPSKQSQGVLGIEGGWNEQRFSFFLEFEIVTPNMVIREIVTGYTDVLGYSNLHGGVSYAPEMCFYINNHMRVSETVREGPHGQQSNMKATDVSQILRPISVSHGNTQSEGGMDVSAVSMRPVDTMQSMQRCSLPGGGNGIIDERYDLTADSKSLGIASSRKNETSSAYLSTILQSYSAAHNSTDGMGNAGWMFGTAANYAQETNLTSSLLFHHLAESTSYGRAGCFTFRELFNAHPEFDYVASPPVLPERGGITSNYGITNEWGAANEFTHLAHALTHTVPAALSQCLLASASFTAHNLTSDGSIDMACQSVVTIFETANDASLAKRFMSTLVHDLFPEIFTIGLEWEISMEVSLFGLSKISIALNGSQFENFTAPNYADGLTSSNIGATVKQLDDIGSQSAEMIDTVFSASRDPGIITRLDHF